MDKRDNDKTSNNNEFTPQQKYMAESNIKKLVIKYSLPPILGMLANALYNTVDRFWVGKMEGIGSIALTGLGVCMPLMNIILGLSMLVGIGAASCISIRLGRREKDGAERILGNSVTLILILSAITTVTGMIFLEDLLRMVGASEQALPYAVEYSRIIIMFSCFNMISFALNHPIRAAGNMKRFASTQLIGAIANIILDPIFIFGFGMGIKGAAYATIIAQFLSACWVVLYYFSVDAPIRIRLKNIMPKIAVVTEIFSIGFAPFIMQVMASFVTTLANTTLMTYGNREFGGGDTAIGAAVVISSVSMMFLMPIFGINQGTQPIIGFNYGMDNINRVKETYKYVILYASAICIAGFIIIQAFSPQIVRIFNDDPELVEVGSRGMRIVSSTMILLGFQLPSITFFQALKRAKISMLLSLLRQFILLIPAYMILPGIFGFNGIWYAMPVADILSTAVVAFFIIREFKLLDNIMLKGEGLKNA